MKRHNNADFEEDESGIESRERNIALVQEFDTIYKLNCQRSGKNLSNIENTKMFMSGSITRLLIPPRTYYADCLKRVSKDLYVQVKK